MTVDRQAISSGYVVFARPDEYGGVGPFVGVVEDVLTIDGDHYVRVRSGLEDVKELCLPLAEVRRVTSHQVHLQLDVEDLDRQAWPLLPRGAALQPVGYWG